MIKFCMYWLLLFVGMMLVAIIMTTNTDIDMTIAFENAPVLSGIFALALTRKD